ncbi:unnamed protein product, partial [Trypanosoma congolense IL3000]
MFSNLGCYNFFSYLFDVFFGFPLLFYSWIVSFPFSRELLLVLFAISLSFIKCLCAVCWDQFFFYVVERNERFLYRRISAFLSQQVVVAVGDRNALLQNAVFYYLFSKFSMISDDVAVWRNKVSVLLLVDPLRCAFEECFDSPFRVDREDDDDDASWDSVNWRSQRKLKRYVLVRVPTNGHWIPVSSDGVELTYERCRDFLNGNEGVVRSIKLRVRNGPNAADRIDNFVRASLEYYIKNVPDVINDGRVLLELQPPLSVSDEECLYFKRYPLREGKTFDTLFFPEKNRILKLLDDFMAKRGRFATEGFPHKLGFLLYGPPGTGKTAFVRALANYTRRNIVLINLSFIKSNSSLYDIFLKPVFYCIGESEPTSLA